MDLQRVNVGSSIRKSSYHLRQQAREPGKIDAVSSSPMPNKVRSMRARNPAPGGAQDGLVGRGRPPGTRSVGNQRTWGRGREWGPDPAGSRAPSDSSLESAPGGTMRSSLKKMFRKYAASRYRRKRWPGWCVAPGKRQTRRLGGDAAPSCLRNAARAPSAANRPSRPYRSRYPRESCPLTYVPRRPWTPDREIKSLKDSAI
jgi:hypothetical protein